MTETASVAGAVPLVGVTPSQMEPAAAVKARGPSLLVTVSVSGAGAVPPTGIAKKSWLGAMVICGGAVMVSVTATAAELDTPKVFTLIVPPYVPAGRPAGFAVTSTLPGVVPRCGLNCSQLPGEVAVKFSGTLPLANAMLCEAGAAPPIW